MRIVLAASDSETSLKDCKWLVIPTLFVFLEGTRLSSRESAKLANLTDLRWDFFFTCWRYNTDFWRKGKLMEWKLKLGIPIYIYYDLLGRRLFRPGLKYPWLRLAHFAGWYLRRKLYLDFSGRQTPRYQVPEKVEVPVERCRPQLPALEPSGGLT